MTAQTPPSAPQPIPAPPPPLNKDAEHVRLLGIFHYVLGGITGFCACIPLIHVTMGIVLLCSPTMFQGPDMPPEMQQVMGGLFLGIGSVAVMLGWTFAILLFVAAGSLRKHKRHMFCLVVAAIGCLSVPMGTVLGVFTILVLSRPTVKAMFEAAPGQPQ